MKIKIVCVGRLKEKYWVAAVSEYVKRLGRYCRMEMIEIKDEPVPEKLSDKQRMQAINAEGSRIVKHLPEIGEIWTMEIDGKALSSEQFAAAIDRAGIDGVGQITFVIGGSLGLSPAVTARATRHLSFSPMTFPHQLFRVMLLEQIYRSFKINSGETYHK